MKIYVYTVSIKNISDLLTEHTKANNLQKLKKKRTTSSLKYLKINKRGVPIRFGGRKNRKINKRPGTFIRNLRVDAQRLAFSYTYGVRLIYMRWFDLTLLMPEA